MKEPADNDIIINKQRQKYSSHGLGVRMKSWTPPRLRKGLNHIALQVYHQCGSVTNTIRILGYSTRRALYTWIESEDIPKAPGKPLDNINTAAHPHNPPIEVKMDVIHRCFELGENTKCM